MKRTVTTVAAMLLSLGSLGIIGVGTASAAPSLPTITLKASLLPDEPNTVSATTSVPGIVNFSANGSALSTCTSVATTTTSPYVATCSYPTGDAGTSVAFTATLWPTDSTDYTTATTSTTAVVATPVQGATNTSGISLYVDTIVASGATGVIAPQYGAGCEIQNQFIQGQTIVFRMYGNDFNLGGAPLSDQNVASAVVTIAGYSTPLTMSYGNHSGVAFFTVPLKTGVAGTAGAYTTLGVINYKVTVQTNDVPAVTKQVTTTKKVEVTKGGKPVLVNGKVQYKNVSTTSTVIVTPAVPGATASFTSQFAATSQLTLNAPISN